MALRFLDTNVLLRHLLQDHADHSPRATALLRRVEGGDLRVRTADTVIFEVVFTLQRHYRISRDAIRANLLPLIQLPGIVVPAKRRLTNAFDLYVDLNLSFGDAYHAALMHELKLDEIVSFDRGLDRVPGIRRVEPEL